MMVRLFVLFALLALLVSGSCLAYSEADLVFSVNHNDLGANGSIITSWGPFTKTGNTGFDPTVATLTNAGTGISVKWAKPAPGTLNSTGGTTAGGSGFTTGIIDGIPNTGFTIVTAIIPSTNNLGGTDYRSIVNAYLGALGLYQMDSGRMAIRLQKTYNTYNSFTTTGAVLSDGVPTVISMVVTSTGAYEVWTDTVSGGSTVSTKVLSGTSSDWPSGMLLPSVSPTGTSITNRNSIGLGSQGGTSSPSTTSFRGYIGDTYLYKTALTNAQRLQLVNSVQQSMGMLFSGATYAISGSVKDTGGNPLAGAPVYFSQSANASVNALLTIVTDANGNYTQQVPPGDWYVSTLKSRYTPNPAPDRLVTVDAANVSGINFTLTPNPTLNKLIDLDAKDLTSGQVSSWTNKGSLGGSFAQDGADGTTLPTITTVAGVKAVTFDGSNDRLKASFTAPSGLTAGSDWTVCAVVYNPAIAAEETYLSWAQRGTGARAAEFGYGSSFSAYHVNANNAWATVPSAGMWHHIAVTYDGAVERTYVDGVLSVQSSTRYLKVWPGQPVFLGTAFEDAAGATKSQWFSGSIASLQVYDEAMTASEVLDAATVTVSGKVMGPRGPLAGAVVGFKSASKAIPGLAISATADADRYIVTDASGNYSVNILRDSSFYVAAWKDGYTPSSDTLIATDAAKIVDISVTSEAGVNLALGRTTQAGKLWASPTGLGTNPVNNAFDGNTATHFSWTTTSQKDLVIDVSKSGGTADSIDGVTIITGTQRPYDWELWVEDSAAPIAGGTRNTSANWTRVYASTGAFGGYDRTAVNGQVVNPVRIAPVSARGVWIKITSGSVSETRPLEVLVHSSNGPVSIGSTKQQPDGSYVVLSSKVVTWAPRDINGNRTTDHFYIEDLERVSGIRVKNPVGVTDTLKINDLVSIAGTMATDPNTNERYINAVLTPAGDAGMGIQPLGMTTRAVQTDPNTFGQYVIVAGKVKSYAPDGTWFTISDGYTDGATEVLTKVIVNGSQLPQNLAAVGNMIAVLGVVSREQTVDGVRSVILLTNYDRTLGTSTANEVTFYAISDLHYGKSGTVAAANRATINEMNLLPGNPYPGPLGGIVQTPRGVIACGDLTESGSTSDWSWFATDYGINGECMLRFPAFEGLGNHDGRVGNAIGVRVKARTPLRRNLTAISSNGIHYSWDWGGIHFVQCGIAPTDINEGNLAGDPNYSLQFLKEDLPANVGNSGRPVILFHHWGFDGFSATWWSDNERANYYNVIKDYNVVAIVHGHTHAAGTYKWNGFDVYQDGAAQVDPNPGGFFVFRIKGNQMSVAQRVYNASTGQWGWGSYWTKTISR